MPAIQFSGLASGLNTTEIISALMSVERIPLQRLEQKNFNYNAKIGVLDSLSSALSSLKTKAQALDTKGEFLSYKGTVSDSDKATVTTSGDAVQGSYSLAITTLAAAQRDYSTTFADQTASLSGSSQTLSITIDGTQTDITVAADSSLEDVVGLINGSGAAVTAGLFYDGSNYRLQVVGDDTGADNAITYNDTGLGLQLGSNTVQAAVDAAFTVDGFSVTSASNVVSDVLPGVTLELEETTTSAVTVEIEPDQESVKTKLTELKDAYNSVFSIINAQVGEGKGENTLNGDSTLRSLEEALSSVMSSAIPSLTDSDGNSLAMSRLGFETQNDGTLTIDTTTLDDFLASDFDGAAKYLVGEPRKQHLGMAELLADQVDLFTQTGDGLLNVRKDGLNDVILDNEDKIADLEAYLATFEQSLQQKYTDLETTMSTLRSQQQYLAQFLLG